MQATYLKEWAVTGPESLRQRAADRIMRALFRLDHRHELFLYLLYDRFFKGQEITALDLGAGAGYALSYADRRIQRWAADSDDHFREEFRQKGIKFIRYDIETYAIEELTEAIGTRVHILFLNHVIEHVREPARLVSQLGSLLHPGGVVYLRTPDIQKFGFEFYNDYSHVSPFTKQSICRLFKANSFDIAGICNTSSLIYYIDAFPLGKRLRRLLSADGLGRDIELVAVKL